MGMFSWFKLKGFLVFAVLVYVCFIVGDWFISAIGIDQYGIAGTLIALMLPVIVLYWAMKTWLSPEKRRKKPAF